MPFVNLAVKQTGDDEADGSLKLKGMKDNSATLDLHPHILR